MSTNDNAPGDAAEDVSEATTEVGAPTETPLAAEGIEGVVRPGIEAATHVPAEDLVPPTGSVEDLVPPAGAPWASDNSDIPQRPLGVDAPLDEEPAPPGRTEHAENTDSSAESRIDASPDEESVPPTEASEDIVPPTGASRTGPDSEIPEQPFESAALVDEKPLSLEDTPQMIAPDVAPVDITPPAGERRGTEPLPERPVEDNRPTGGAS